MKFQDIIIVLGIISVVAVVTGSFFFSLISNYDDEFNQTALDTSYTVNISTTTSNYEQLGNKTLEAVHGGNIGLLDAASLIYNSLTTTIFTLFESLAIFKTIFLIMSNVIQFENAGIFIGLAITVITVLIVALLLKYFGKVEL
jgi:hypothetical protein